MRVEERKKNLIFKKQNLVSLTFVKNLGIFPIGLLKITNLLLAVFPRRGLRAPRALGEICPWMLHVHLGVAGSVCTGSRVWAWLGRGLTRSPYTLCLSSLSKLQMLIFHVELIILPHGLL